MKTKFGIILILISTLTTGCMPQNNNTKGDTSEYIKKELIQYPSDNSGNCLEDIKLGKQMIVEFLFICASVDLYLDGKLINELILDHGPFKSVTGFITIDLGNNPKPLLKIVFPNQKVYYETVLDKRYKVIILYPPPPEEDRSGLTFRYANCPLRDE